MVALDLFPGVLATPSQIAVLERSDSVKKIVVDHWSFYLPKRRQRVCLFHGFGTPICESTTILAGEIKELREELRSLDKLRKKEAVKKVIASMTVGKDVSMLFPDVVNNMQTADLELKKLVYLYLINYSKTQPDLAIMAVNTFVKVRTVAGIADVRPGSFERSLW